MAKNLQKSSKKIRRVFYHYTELEETAAGMWKRVTGDARIQFVEAAADLMRNSQEFEEAMRSAASEWPKSCKAAFTADAVNKIAFLGHVGCCVATGSPEECTRVAWHTLTKEEQDAANLAADIVLREWLIEHAKTEQDNQMDLFNA